MRQQHYILIALGLMLLGVALPESVVAQYYPERRLVREGNEQFDARNYNNSFKKYDEAYLVDSTVYETLYNRANAYYHLKANTPKDKELTYETSNALYEKIAADTLLTKGQRAEVLRNLGESLFMQQEYEVALNTFRESLRLNPNDQETKYNYVLTKRIVDQKRASQNQDQNQDQSQDQNQDQNQNQDQSGGGENQDKGDENSNENKDENSGNGNEDSEQGDNKQNQSQGDKDPQDKEDKNDPNGGKDKQDGEGDKEQNSAPQPKELSPEKERMLDAIQAEEDRTQEKLGEEGKAVVIPGKKNW